ncbi:unnamed protein product [Cylindrotheca closterium]|uniref:Histone RNA hairpin-binding protein RNA-binding domain-containing protein n=1 Tax=Cylindrotheca closterium TaxID=2856 RepID=A0AAD2FVP1_9STRA|nr:unnamed protein product [Cylindrotheca closterium]
MTKQTPLHRSAQSDKGSIPHRGSHTYTKSKNSLRRNSNSNSNSQNQSSKNLTFVSKSCQKVAEAAFKKLDPSIPEQAKRLQTRRRMISYGKNTLGYDEYLRQVPKEKRQPRCMETPSTPDYTLDMPNKRWMGQVRAWRRALHTYDPADLQTAFAESSMEQQASTASTMDTTSGDNNNNNSNDNNKSVQELQVEQAKAAGLPVQFASSSSDTTSTSQNPSPTSVMGASKVFEELDQWEDKRNNTVGDLDDFVSEGGDLSDESDDDLL